MKVRSQAATSFADYCTGKIWTLDADDPHQIELMIDTDLNIAAFALIDGEVYVLSHNIPVAELRRMVWVCLQCGQVQQVLRGVIHW